MIASRKVPVRLLSNGGYNFFMPITLLASKFFQPPPPIGQVNRTRLYHRLDEGLRLKRPLILVSAPAGYGKSTLVSEWLSLQAHPAAWLSIDEADDEAGRFLLYFVAALQKLEPAFGADIFSTLQAGQLPPLDVLVTALLNELHTWEASHILILDDFQHIQNQYSLDCLSQLLTHQPRSLSLILVTREDPTFPLARLRASGRLTEIRAADLRFSDEESLHFLCNGLGLSLSDGDVANLTERTEGWAAGLQLAGLLLQGRENPAELIESLRGSHRFILSYLTEEVLKRQTAEIQTFLLQTSILGRLNGDLCDLLTGETGGEARLESLLSANLFLIPLDEDGHWYRYHHLFAELLQSQLRHKHPERVAELHRRASVWYAAHSMPVEAVEHALNAGDAGYAASLLETFSWSLLNQGYGRQMEIWMQAIPPELRNQSPRASLGFGWMHLLRANFEPAQTYLLQAQTAIARLEHDEAANALRAEALALHANLAQSRGDLATSIDAARQALELVPQDGGRITGLAWLAIGGTYRQSAAYALAADALQHSAQASWQSQDWVTWMLAISHLTLMSIQYGRLRFAAETASRAVEQLKNLHLAPPPIIGAIYGALGLVNFELNRLPEARENFARGIRLATFSGHTGSLIYNQVNLARLQQAEGDLETAWQTLEEAAGLLRLGSPGWMRSEYIYRRVSILLAMGRPAEAEVELRQSGMAPADEITHRSDWVHLAWLRLLVTQRSPAALDLAARIIHFAEADSRDGVTIQALILGVLAGGSSDWLARALELAEREGYLRVFLDEGAQLKNSEFKKMQIPPNQLVYLEKISAAQNPPPAPAVKSTLIVQLTGRELEVLRLLADGLSYAETADRLVVSVNTVRYHIKGIYGKLGVEKQVQAVEKGRELGLI